MKPEERSYETTVQFFIIDTHTGQYAGGPYTSRSRASKRVDRLDNAHGSYRYSVVRVVKHTVSP